MVVKSLIEEEGEVKPDIVKDKEEVPVIPEIEILEEETTEQLPVKPMKELHVSVEGVRLGAKVIR